MMSSEELAEVVQYIESYASLAEKFVPIIMKIGGDIEPIIISLTDYVVDNTIRMILRYEKAGFTREDAILLTISNRDNLIKSLQQSSKKINT